MMKAAIDLKSSKIYIGKGILSEIGVLIKKQNGGAKVLIVTDENVKKLYLDKVIADFEANDIEYNTLVLKDGEDTKTLQNLGQVCENAADCNLNRGDIIIALGGGVVGDLAGFAAAVYLRGIKFIAVPTTLLAQVDSSVGGKTGVNLPQGKNLVGSFYKADSVFIDTDTLKTLDDNEFCCGMAEVIKYGCIKDKEFFEMLEKLESREEVMSRIEEIVRKCCEIKAEIVREDEFDKGLRMILNFGHTIGHAVERMQGYGELTHGQAVAIGMVKISKASEKKGITEIGTTRRLEKLLIKHGLAIDIEGFDVDSIFEATMKDKKNIGKTMNIVLLKRIGEVTVEQISPAEMVEYI